MERVPAGSRTRDEQFLAGPVGEGDRAVAVGEIEP